VLASEIEYRAHIQARLLELLKKGPLDLRALVLQADGAYPSIVKKELEELVSIKQVVWQNLKYSTPNVSLDIPVRHTEYQENYELLGARNGSYDPHPVDYDWRFTQNSVEDLLSMLMKKGNTQSALALFGTTSLFVPLTKLGLKPELYNKSNFLIEEIKNNGYDRGLYVHDLFKPIQERNSAFEIVVADPPWYPDYYRAFILRSTEVLKIDGYLFLCLFPWLTRPEATIEREEINQYALSAGFDIQEVLPSFLRYATPRFEKMALKTEGIDLNHDWRTGDLFILRKVRQPADGIDILAPRIESEWDEFLVFGKRVKLKKRVEPENSAVSFQHVDESKVLRNVSRRSPLRSRIDLWTSDNEAYSVTGVRLINAALTSMQQGFNVEETINSLSGPGLVSQVNLTKLKELLIDLTSID